MQELTTIPEDAVRRHGFMDIDGPHPPSSSSTIGEVTGKIYYQAGKRQADKQAIYAFNIYLKKEDKGNTLLSCFEELEFLRFLHYLAKTKSATARYNISTAVRRLLADEYNNGAGFVRDPHHWPVPQKPKPQHFEPLSSEELKPLKEFLRREINIAYQKEKGFKEAIENGSISTKIGSDFWQRANPKFNLPKFSNWQDSLQNTIVTLFSVHPNFPNNATPENFQIDGNFHIPKDLIYTNLTTPFKTIVKRLVMQNVGGYKAFMPDAPHLTYSEVMSYIYPDFRELAAIKIAICLETGWSPDITERINPHDFIYAPIPMDSNWVFIKSTKAKGAAVNQDTKIREQKLMIHPSSKSDPLSAYNLIQLLIQRTSRLRHGTLYNQVIKEIDTHPIFISFSTLGGSKFAVHHPARQNINRSASSRFIEKELGFKLDLRQLRPTRLYLNEKENNLPLLLQVALFGHSSSAITDEFYKESSHFKQLRKDKLAVELDCIFESISDGSFKGKLVPLRHKTSLKKKIINIYTNHNGESPLAICNDPYHPSWHLLNGAPLPKQHKPCKQFNKCLECQQSSVTNDNIPFVVDRFLYLDQKRRSMRNDQFDSMYRGEYEAAKEVIDSWPYQEEISEAEFRNAIDGYLLPPVISEGGE
ncbi:hypothetical protein AB4320_05570 [Vibrio splendidus]